MTLHEILPPGRRMRLATGSVLVLAALTAGCTHAAKSAAVPMTDEGSVASASSASAAAASSVAEARAAAAGTAAHTSAAATSSAASRTPAAPAAPVTVDVMITYAGFQSSTGTVEVGGVADGIVESDGQCTLTLTSTGHADVQLVQPATPDVRSTACGGFSVPKSQLASGSWTAHLAYRSSHSVGSAAATGFDVP